MSLQKCRIWWPKHLCPPKTQSSSCSLVLFGWFVSSSSTSVDMVVAFASDEAPFSHHPQSVIEGAIYNVNERMPILLQDKSSFSVLGCCLQNAGSGDHLPNVQIKNGDQGKVFHQESCLQDTMFSSLENFGQWSCGCSEVDGLLDQHKQHVLANFSWIRLQYDSCECSDGEFCWTPKFLHMHWSGEILSKLDLHVIFYDMPTFGGNHFSLSSSSSKVEKQSTNRPKWIVELYQKKQNTDMDIVIMAINSAAAANMLFNKHLGLPRYCGWFVVVDRFHNLIWRLFAAAVASFATLLYMVLQFFHLLSKIGSKFQIYILFMKLFSNTSKYIHIRCCQFLYWPIFLKEYGFRSRSCIQYTEKAAVRRHYIWSSIVVDILLGNLVGFTLFFHAETTCKWIMNLAKHITDEVLRSGCVWLMGVPAGFKLNTELAGVLGLIALNAIQIWSTLWFSVAKIFDYIIKAVAFSGIFFGVTIPAACFIDMIQAATLHVSTLNWFISLFYSHQIQALNALWHLFRGQKSNPLRHRLDSYDYSVEQHIVGSLLFTPVLLLLPTTSVFYMFFSIMDMTSIISRMLVEMTISVIHATPYYEILLWLVRPGRFPSGIWFEVVHCQEKKELDNNVEGHNSTFLISILQSNIMSFGDVILPSYRKVFGGVSSSRIALSVYGVLTGKKLPKMLGCGLPSPIPWMHIPCKVYWWICYDSIVACLQP